MYMIFINANKIVDLSIYFSPAEAAGSETPEIQIMRKRESESSSSRQNERKEMV